MQRQPSNRGWPAPGETDWPAPLITSPPWHTETVAPPDPETVNTVPLVDALTEEQVLAGGPPPPPRERRSWLRRPSTYLLFVLALLLVLGAGIGGGVLGARLVPAGQQVTLSARVADVQQALENASQGVQPSVVEIRSYALSYGSLASGIVLTSDGYIVTNDHVVNGFSTYTVTLSNGKMFDARVIGEDGQDDLAVLKIEGRDLTPVSFADSSKVALGQFVAAVGSPVGFEKTATFGVVSGLNRTVSEAPSGPATILAGLIQTNAAINPGSSGGALVDLQGRLIGMPALRVASIYNGTDYPTAIEGMGFAIPANRIAYVAAQLIHYGRLVNSGQGYLAIEGENVTPQLAEDRNLSVKSGILVMGFSDDGLPTNPARQAGIRINDVITAVNGEAVAGTDDLAGVVLTHSPNTHITLTVMRGTEQRTIAVTLSERPVSA